VDSSGDVYVADGARNVVVKITPAGSLSVVAGTGQQGKATPGPATQSDLNDPYGVAVDGSGNVYVDDIGNDVVEKVSPQGTLSIIAGTGQPGTPTPGPATASDLGRPTAVAADASGNLYIADQVNSEVDEVTPAGALSVIAGTGRYGDPTPGLATRSRLGWLDGLAVDSSGNVYIANSEASALILKVTPAGTLSIIAGMLHHHGAITPGPATRSALGGPFAVAVDATGDVYIADLPNYAVEQLTSAGVLSVIAGRGALPLPGADQAQLNTLVYPQGVAVSPTGDLYIASTQAGVVEKVADAPNADSYGRPRISVGPPSVHRRSVTQTLSCVAGSAQCEATATLRMVTRGRRGKLLAQEHLKIPVGSFKTWTLPPNQATKRLLRKLGSLRIALTITARRASLVTTPTDGILFPQPFHKTLVLRSDAA
jgi:sugar lactone lactonase YvrE